MKNILNEIKPSKPVSPLHIDDKPIRYIGFVILLLTFGIFGVWAYTAPLDSSAAASGVVAVKSHKKTVQHLDGGIVGKLLAKDGDTVKEGQPILILDDTQAKAQQEIMRGQFITLSAQVARLQAERDRLGDVMFPKELNHQNDERIDEAKRSESHVFLSRKHAYEGEISVLKQRINEIGSKINGLEGQIRSKRELVASYVDEIHDLKELLAEGFADKQRLRDLQRSYALNQGEISQLTSEIASSQMQQSETRLQILQIEQKFQEEVANKLSESQSQLYDITERLMATQDKLEHMVIKAPVSGMVLGLSVHTEGGVITPGKPILDIVPQDAELIIDARVSTIDIDRVTVGLTSEIRFSAFKQALTPVMYGKVTHISADSLVDERTGVPYYQARIEVTPDSLVKLREAHFQLVPGMPAEVLINTGERTLFEYLTKPITNAIAHALIED
jgi:epimerase transport system membrane fusion protein